MASRIWTYFKPMIDAIIFSNIWIALAALSLFSALLRVSGNKEEFYAALTIFSSTFIGYNFLKLKGIEHVANDSVFFHWMRKYQLVVYTLLFLSFITLVIALFYLSFLQISAAALCAFVALVYVGFEKYNLRHFWFLKTPIVAFVWAVFIVALAFVNIYESITCAKLISILLACFLFIQGLTIPFEIRDLKADSKVKELQTIPMLFGISMTKKIAIVHLFFALVFFALYDIKLLILTPILLLAVTVIYYLREDSSEYYYTFVLDGLIVLTFPLIYLFY